MTYRLIQLNIVFIRILTLTSIPGLVFVFLNQACPQPAKGQLWAHAWFTEIVFIKVCVYLSTYLPIYVCPYAPLYTPT